MVYAGYISEAITAMMLTESEAEEENYQVDYRII